jgi:hypothetical protein
MKIISNVHPQVGRPARVGQLQNYTRYKRIHRDFSKGIKKEYFETLKDNASGNFLSTEVTLFRKTVTSCVSVNP